METIPKSNEGVPATESKPWQKGFQIDYLKDLEKRFTSYNDYAQHEMSKFKKNNIAEALSKDELQLLGKGLIHYSQVKVKSNIFMFPGVLIGTKLPGDIHIKHLGYTDEFDKRNIITTLMEDTQYINNNVWLFINEESGPDKHIASETGFDYVGSKFNSVADIIGVYFRHAGNVLEDRQHPKIPVYEKYTLKPMNVSFDDITKQLAKQLHDMEVEFTNHYSNYNKAKSWSAISLRGYSSDYKFITKPVEMNKKWKEENKDEQFELQDTDWRKKFPLVEKILDVFETEIHRVRFMNLKPGGGELQRHTDQVDPDLGIADGRLMRIHIPIKTNPDVEFTSWSTSGTKVMTNMEEGSCWYLDIRKPHMAINNGDEWRTHLVIDVVANDKVRKLFNADAHRKIR
jgi:hypothetical protein|tara:strand:- start:1296 stop:2495 length:1200 start_codon:yes stop_codon:yes gene_type:complete